MAVALVIIKIKTQFKQNSTDKGTYFNIIA